MNYKEMRKLVNELDDKVEKARHNACYEVKRLATDLSYSGEGNREPVDVVLEQMSKAKDAMNEYIHLCKEYAKMTEKEFDIDDDWVA